MGLAILAASLVLTAVSPGLGLKVQPAPGALVTPRAQPLLQAQVKSAAAVTARVALLDARGRALARSGAVALRAQRTRTVDLRLTALGETTLGRCGRARLTLVATAPTGEARFRTRAVRDAVRCAPLRWPPPPLAHPQRITLASGFSNVRLQSGRDYVLRLPRGRKLGGAFIEGGHNVVVIGGRISLPADAATDQQRRGLYFKHQTGTVHVEGVSIDGFEGEGDGIAIDAPEAIVQLENVRIAGLRGSQAGTHSDVVQPWGGVRQLRIDRLTGSSAFQGLQLPVSMGPIGAAYLRFVDLHALSAPSAQGGGHMLWLTNPGSCSGYTIALEQVYVVPRPGRTLANSVWPGVSDGSSCAAVDKGGSVQWPGLPVRGEVLAGSPDGGEFVPRWSVGSRYRSPGYATAGQGASVTRSLPAPASGRGAASAP
jgi:hypothetical protein